MHELVNEEGRRTFGKKMQSMLGEYRNA